MDKISQTIRRDIRLWKYALIFCASAIVISSISYYMYRHLYYNKTKKTLQAFLVKKEQETNSFFDNLIKDTTTFAQDPEVLDTFKKSLTFFSDDPTATRNRLYSTEYAEFLKKHVPIMQKKRAPLSLRNVLFLAPNGQLIFTERIREDFALVIPDSIFKDTDFAHVITKVIATKKPAVSDFNHYPTSDKPTSFSAIPIFENGQFIGIVAAKMFEEHFYKLIQGTEQLGKTTEVIFGKKDDNSIVFIMPVKDDPNAALMRKVPIGDKRSESIQKGVEGISGTTIGIDYQGHNVLSTWMPYKRFGWALAINKHISEIEQELTFARSLWIYFCISIIVLFVLTSLILFCILYFHHLISIQSVIVKQIWPYALPTAFLITIGAILFLAQRSLYLHFFVGESVENKTKIRGQYAIQLLARYFAGIEKIADNLAESMKKEKKDSATIFPLLTNIIQESNDIKRLIVAYKTDEASPFAPYAYRKDSTIETGTIEKYYNYLKPNATMPQYPGYTKTTSWYQEFIKASPTWTEPFYDMISNELVIAYLTPFYSENDTQSPIGVIAAFYALADLKTKMLELGTSGTGYNFIINQTGQLLYHPNDVFVLEQKTIFDLAKKYHDPSLELLGKKMLQETRGLEGNIIEPIFNQKVSVYFQRIPIAQWKLGIVFLDEGIVKDGKQLREALMLLAVLMVFLGLLILLFTYTFKIIQNLHRLGLMYSLIALMGVITILHIHLSAPVLLHENVILDRLSLQLYLDEIETLIRERHEAPFTTIKTGIFVDTLDLSTFGIINFNGSLWQEYPQNFEETIKKGVKFPQNFDVKMEKSYSLKEAEKLFEGWDVRAKLVQEHSLKRYPFDEIHVKILMSFLDETQRIVLTPYLESYDLVNPSAMPGFNRQFLSPGYSLKRSFFSFEKIKPDTYFGIPRNLKNAEKIYLTYNILFRRSLLQTFIVFLFPLIVILFWLYFVLRGIEKKETADYSMITVYTSLFFSAIIGHQIFRNQFKLSIVTYMEYLYLFVYLSIFSLVLYSVALVLNDKFRENRIYISQNFWPIIMTCWLVITFFTFYE